MTAASALECTSSFLRRAAAAIGRRLASVPLALFAGFFVFYGIAAQELRDTPVFDRLDVFFQSDSRRVWKDMVGERLGRHSHASGHPNFVILHQPVGWSLATGIKKFGYNVKKVDAGETASILMTSAAAAGTVALFYLLLIAHQIPRSRSVLFSCVLGFSTVQMFFAGIPETYMFSALGLTAAALIASRRDSGEAWWQVAAVYAWSSLTTNIVQLGLWAIARHWRRPLLACVKRVALAMGITVVIMVALSLMQSVIYPGTALFFLPHSVAREAHWLYWERLDSPLETTRILLQHQWLSNIIAPEAVKIMNPFRPTWATASIEAGTWDMFAPAWPLFALWCAILAGAATSLCSKRFYTPTILAALGVMAFNFCFFFVFGHDRMLYAALWTSTAVFLVAAGWETLVQRRPALALPLIVTLIVLVIGQAWHNWHFLGKIAALVK